MKRFVPLFEEFENAFVVNESIEYGMSVQQATEYYYDLYNQQLFDAINNAKKRVVPSWKRINKDAAKRLWRQFMKLGFVRDDEVLDDIAYTIADNVARLHVYTMLCGHTSTNPVAEVEDTYEEKLDEETWQFIYDRLVFDERTKQDCISDYGLEPLLNVVNKILMSKDSKERLLACDMAFNIIHQRGNLAEIFIIGGRSALDELKNE